MRTTTARAMFVLSLGLLLCPPSAPAAEEAAPGAAGNRQTVISASAGYQALSIDGGGETLLPFANLDSHPVAGFDLSSYLSWPAIIDLSAAWDGDTFYALKGDFNYRGDVYFEVHADRAPRNREHQLLPPSMAGSRPTFLADDKNPLDEYHLDLLNADARLKVRIPNYPAHVSLGASQYRITGDRQQIFLDQNCVTECHNISQTRKVDTTTNRISAGVDAHVNPLDLSYAFKGQTFKDGEPDPVYNYKILFGYRTPGPKEHNVYPSTSSADHLFTLSTNAASRLTAKLGLGFGRRENSDADLTEKYGTRAGSVIWRPHPVVNVALKYNFVDRADESPGGSSADLKTKAGQPLSFGTEETSLAATVNVYPVRGLRLRGDASRKTVDRDDAEAWELPDKTTISTWKLSAQYKPVRTVTLDGYVRNQRQDDPAYEITPEDRSDYYLSFNWQPWTYLLFRSSYLGVKGDSDDPASRHDRRRVLQGGLTLSFPQAWTAGLYYFAFVNDLDRDLDIGAPAGFLSHNPDAPYRSDGDQFLLQAAWKPLDAVELRAEAGLLRAKGDYSVANPPFDDIGTYSAFKAVQKTLSLAVSWALDANWSLSANGAYLTYDDKIAADGDETVRALWAMVTRKW